MSSANNSEQILKNIQRLLEEQTRLLKALLEK